MNHKSASNDPDARASDAVRKCEVTNHRERVLRVDATCTPRSDESSHLQVNFQLDFAFENMTLRSHRVRFGLRGGELRYLLQDVVALLVTPAHEIQASLPETISHTLSSGATAAGKAALDAKGGTLESSFEASSRDTTAKTINTLYCQIRSGGDATCPIWSFSSPHASQLEGRCSTPSVICDYVPSQSPLGTFFFTTTLGDWVFEVQQLSTALPAYRRFWVRHGIQRDATRITQTLAGGLKLLSEGTV